MRKTFSHIISLLLLGCSSHKPYKPEKGTLQIKFKKIEEIPLKEGTHKVSVVLDGKNRIIFASKSTNIFEDRATVFVYEKDSEPRVLIPKETLWYFPNLYFVNNYLWATTPNEAVKVSGTGKIEDKFSFNDIYDRLIPLGEDKFIASVTEIPKEKEPQKVLYLLENPYGAKKKIIEGKSGDITVPALKKGTYIYAPLLVPSLVWAYSQYSHHIIAGNNDNYQLAILSTDGKTIKKISFKYTKVKVPEDVKKNYAEIIVPKDVSHRDMVVSELSKSLPDELPVFKRIIPLPGNMFMMEVNDKENKSHFDVITEDGKYIYNLQIPEGYSLIDVLSNGYIVLKKGEEVAVYKITEPKDLF